MRNRDHNLLLEQINDTDEPAKSLGEIDNGVSSGNVRVAFRNVEHFVVNAIRQYDAVFGCVAWMTNREILAALASRKDTSIIVQKEDFLRPDRGGPTGKELRNWYSQLPNARGSDGFHQFGYNFGCAAETEAVRCVGYVSGKDRTLPRMHNKFLVLCELEIENGVHYPVTHIVPCAVITGSFNMTSNATRSLENVVLIEDAGVARAYYDEFITIYGISEPLNWRKPYVDPHYAEGLDVRIGT